MHKRDVVSTYNELLFCLPKEGDSDTCNNIDDPGGHCQMKEVSHKRTTSIWSTYVTSHIVMFIEARGETGGCQGLEGLLFSG